MAEKSPTKQMQFLRVKGWGGKRAGAGRKNLSGQVSHARRPTLLSRYPVHITLKLKKGLSSLRKKRFLSALRGGFVRAKRYKLAVLHFSIQSNHVHLLVEAPNNSSLSKGIQSLSSRFAKIIRRNAFKNGSAQSGSVFAGRYHMRILKTPSEVRNALEYILLNFSKHTRMIETIDRFSSGTSFSKWSVLLGKRFRALIASDALFWKTIKDSRRLALSAEIKANGNSGKCSQSFWGAMIVRKYASLSTMNNDDEIGNDGLSSPRTWLAKAGWMKAA